MKIHTPKRECKYSPDCQCEGRVKHPKREKKEQKELREAYRSFKIVEDKDRFHKLTLKEKLEALRIRAIQK